MNEQKRDVKTAIIAAGGIGTRFRPLTYLIPKELLPVGDLPIIHRLIHECVSNGIENIYVVFRSPLTSQYIDRVVRPEIPSHCQLSIFEVNDSFPYSNIQSIQTIQGLLEKQEQFLLLWCDDLVLSKKMSHISLLIKKYKSEFCAGVISIEKLSGKYAKDFGLVEIKKDGSVAKIIPKSKDLSPIPKYVLAGQMILSTKLFLLFDEIQKDDERDLAIILNLFAKRTTLQSLTISGKWITVGDPQNYARAITAEALFSGRISQEDIDYMSKLVLG
jgi:NDP-sugar pyrophosphorylase family protein